LKDYVEHGLFPLKIGTPEYQAVLRIEDPYNYRKRPQLRMPKYMINASGDQFFLPDGSQFYYADLPTKSTCCVRAQRQTQPGRLRRGGERVGVTTRRL